MKIQILIIILLLSFSVFSNEDQYFDIKYPAENIGKVTDNDMLIEVITLLNSHKSIIDDCENMRKFKTSVIPDFQELFLMEWKHKYRAITFLEDLQVKQKNNVLGCDYYNDFLGSSVESFNKGFADKLREKHKNYIKPDTALK